MTDNSPIPQGSLIRCSWLEIQENGREILENIIFCLVQFNSDKFVLIDMWSGNRWSSLPLKGKNGYISFSDLQTYLLNFTNESRKLKKFGVIGHLSDINVYDLL